MTQHVAQGSAQDAQDAQDTARDTAQNRTQETVREPRVEDALVTDLRAELGSQAVLTDADVAGSYARDMMPLAPHGAPLAVVMPTDVEGVQATVRACAAAGVPIVPRGTGSGLSEIGRAHV